MCEAEFAMWASILETTGQGGAEVSIWVLLKTAVGGSGCQGLCFHQYSSKNKLLRSLEPLVSLPAIRLTLWLLTVKVLTQELQPCRR